MCLQETKLADDGVPGDGVPDARLRERPPRRGAVERRRHPVSRVGLDDVVAGSPTTTSLTREARLLWATCGGVRVASVYVPNGRERRRRAVRVQARVARAACGPASTRAPTPTRRRRRVRRLQHRPDRRRRVGPRRVRRTPPTSARPSAQALDALAGVGTRRHVPPPPARAPAVLVVGLPGRHVPQAPGHADRSRPGQPSARRPRRRSPSSTATPARASFRPITPRAG